MGSLKPVNVVYKVPGEVEDKELDPSLEKKKKMSKIAYTLNKLLNVNRPKCVLYKKIEGVGEMT